VGKRGVDIIVAKVGKPGYVTLAAIVFRTARARRLPNFSPTTLLWLHHPCRPAPRLTQQVRELALRRFSRARQFRALANREEVPGDSLDRGSRFW
jgi:hypothetical protein